MKASVKMQKSITKVEKKYGELKKEFFVEQNPDNRVRRGFYDGCELTSDIFQSLKIVVAHDGSIYKF